MKKIISILLTLTILNAVSFSNISAFVPAPSPTAFPSSYELFYPLVAGKIPGDKYYGLKTAREWITDKLFFSSIRKADYHLILSKKRLVEAESQILKNKDFSQINKSLTKTVNEIKKTIEIGKIVGARGEQAKDLFNTVKIVGTNEADFIDKTLLKMVPENQKGFFSKTSQTIRDIVNQIN